MCCGRTTIAGTTSKERVDQTKDGEKITTVVRGYGPVVQYNGEGNVVNKKVVYSANNGIISRHARLSATRHRSDLPHANSDETAFDSAGIPDASIADAETGGFGQNTSNIERKDRDRGRNKNDRRSKRVDKDSD